jgi:hypothetical protein
MMRDVDGMKKWWWLGQGDGGGKNQGINVGSKQNKGKGRPNFYLEIPPSLFIRAIFVAEQWHKGTQKKIGMSVAEISALISGTSDPSSMTPSSSR